MPLVASCMHQGCGSPAVQVRFRETSSANGCLGFPGNPGHQIPDLDYRFMAGGPPANHQHRSPHSAIGGSPPAASDQIRYRLMKAGAFEPGTEVERTMEQRVEALEAEVGSLGSRIG